MMQVRSVRTRRWSRREYETLVEHGLFRCNERLELLDGLLLVKEPQSSAHMTALRLVGDALRIVRVLGPDAAVSPLAASAARVAVADLLT